MGKKIYIGDQEIGTGSGGGGSVINPSDYVDTSTWDAHEKVIASALVELKSLEGLIEAFDESIQAQENALLAEVLAVEVAKADASTVYIKSDIDKSDKVVAAALAELNDRVSTLETSSGGGGGSGSGSSFDPEYLEEDILDVSSRLEFLGDLTLDISARVDVLEAGSGTGTSFDPTDINSSISDISTRVNTIETDYVVSNDLSTFLTADDVSNYITGDDISVFVTQTALDASYNALDASIIALDASALSFDASIIALDASALSFDASIRELAEGGGGGGITPEQLDASLHDYTYDKAWIDASSLNYFKPGVITNIVNNVNEDRSFYLGQKVSVVSGSLNSAVFVSGIYPNISGSYNKGLTVLSYCQQNNNYMNLNYCLGTLVLVYSYTRDYGEKMNIRGMGNTITGYFHGNDSNSSKVSCVSTGRYSKGCHIEGFCHNIRIGDLLGIHVEGFENQVSSNAEHAEGKNNISYKQDSTFGSPLNTLSTIGNGASDSSRHNAFEVRQSGDIYVADVSAAGEYYEKPMINLQQKIYELEARIATLESQLPSA